MTRIIVMDHVSSDRPVYRYPLRSRRPRPYNIRIRAYVRRLFTHVRLVLNGEKRSPHHPAARSSRVSFLSIQRVLLKISTLSVLHTHTHTHTRSVRLCLYDVSYCIIRVPTRTSERDCYVPGPFRSPIRTWPRTLQRLNPTLPLFFVRAHRILFLLRKTHVFRTPVVRPAFVFLL